MGSVSWVSMVGIHARIAKEPGWGIALSQMTEMVQNFPPEYQDAIFQYHHHVSIDIYIAYCFALITGWIEAGMVLMKIINLGIEPISDRRIGANNDLLSFLPSPFEATFTGSKSTRERDDGSFSWSCPIEIDGKMIAPSKIALEVGFTKADTTLTHIFRGGVARWPYKSSWIWLFIPTKGFIDWATSRRYRLLEDEYKEQNKTIQLEMDLTR